MLGIENMMQKAILISLVWAMLVTDGMVNCAINLTTLYGNFRHGNNNHAKAPRPQPVNAESSNTSQIPFYNDKTSKFYVNGSTIPDVEFDAGPSYAGSLDVGKSADGELFFWFWPTTHPNPDKSILIWLNGGPGCSSMLGLFEETGPILWQPGTWKPFQNYWSWHRLTNVVYIDQPIGTGFSVGSVTALDEDDVASQFMGFWKNFVDAFDLHGYEIYFAGESYAGMYCPYIGSNFLDANNTQYFNLSGLMLYDALIGDMAVQRLIGAAYHLDYWSNAMPFNKTTMDTIHNMNIECQYADYVDRYLTFPPPGPQPAVPPGSGTFWGIGFEACDMMGAIFEAISWVNPSWNIYQLTQPPPTLDDPLNVFGWNDREPYFNRTDVKKAINAPPDREWVGCRSGVFASSVDPSEKPILYALPKIIDRTKNVIISQGMNDFVFNPNGTLLAIQNMTWGGQLGFQTQPNSPLFVPHHGGTPTVIPLSLRAPVSDQSPPSGVLGTTHVERGLTWNLIMNAGHMIPMFQAALAFRQVEVLLGRVSNMSSTDPFVISPDGSRAGGPAQPRPDELGDPVGPILGRPAASSHH